MSKDITYVAFDRKLLLKWFVKGGMIVYAPTKTKLQVVPFSKPEHFTKAIHLAEPKSE